MTDPTRVPCCISGCRRTFKRQAGDDESTRIMCGRHFRCDAVLLGRMRRTRRRYQRFNRQFEAIDRLLRRPQELSAPRHRSLKQRHLKLARICNKLWHRDQAAWEEIRVEAQRQQDAGFFAPKPRSRRKPAETALPDPLSSRFEDQFRRLKRMM